MGQRKRQQADENPKNDTIGNLGYPFVCIGLYYCSAIDEFGEMEGGFSESVTDGTGRTWRLVSTELVDWMAATISKAFGSDMVNDADLGAAILKFYRVRDRLAEEMADWLADASTMAPSLAADGSKAGTHRPGGGAGEAAAAGEQVAA